MKDVLLCFFQANIVRQILCMLEGLLPSMKNTDEDDYFTKPREGGKVDDDSDDEVGHKTSLLKRHVP